MNILVCGAAPCLISDIKDKDLSKFDKIVRVNRWDNVVKGNVWAGQPNEYASVSKAAKDAEEMWSVTPNGRKLILKITGREIDYAITREDTGKLHLDMGQTGPTSGVVAIWMALNLGANVYVCGFDSYSSDHPYYNPDSSFPNDPAHDLKNEREWFLKKIDLGIFKYFK